MSNPQDNRLFNVVVSFNSILKVTSHLNHMTLYDTLYKPDPALFPILPNFLQVRMNLPTYINLFL